MSTLVWFEFLVGDLIWWREIFCAVFSVFFMEKPLYPALSVWITTGPLSGSCSWACTISAQCVMTNWTVLCTSRCSRTHPTLILVLTSVALDVALDDVTVLSWPLVVKDSSSRKLSRFKCQIFQTLILWLFQLWISLVRLILCSLDICECHWQKLAVLLKV